MTNTTTSTFPVTLADSKVNGGIQGHQHSEIPWSNFFFAGIALAILCVGFGMRLEKELEHRRKVKDLLKKQEIEDARVLAEAKRIMERAEADPGTVSRTEEPRRPKATAVAPVVTPAVTGAAPAQHVSQVPTPVVDLMAQHPSSASPEADGGYSSHEEEVDSHILSGRGAPIAPGMSEVVAAHLRAQQAAQA